MTAKMKEPERSIPGCRGSLVWVQPRRRLFDSATLKCAGLHVGRHAQSFGASGLNCGVATRRVEG